MLFNLKLITNLEKMLVDAALCRASKSLVFNTPEHGPKISNKIGCWRATFEVR